MNLPPSLAPWSKFLNIFPDEISVALGPIVQRIALAVGSPRVQLMEQTGEPDGFDGLNRRGGYERLLLSEWMLADEMQEEFMRRAVMGEHLFLNVAHSSPTGTRASLALFDAGPSQLGAPRIAHLAALIVLANRAASIGASFAWGVLQQPEVPFFRDVTASNVKSLLEARSHREGTETEVKACASRADSWSSMDDVWLIGGARLSHLEADKKISRLYVADPLEPGVRQLSLAVYSASNALRKVVLDLPGDKVSTRLLRDPFAVSVAEIQEVERTVSLGANLLFDKPGTKLFVRNERWGVTAFNVPNSPRGGAGQPKKYRTRRWQTVAAVGKVGRGIALVSAEDHFLRLEFCKQGNTKVTAGNYTGYNQNVFYTPPGDDNAPLMPCFSFPWGAEVAVLDAAGSLFRLVKLSGEEKTITGKPVVGTAQLIATEVLAVATVNSRVVYVGKEWPGESVYIVSLGTEIARMAIPFEGKAIKAFFGPPTTITHEKFGLLAIEQTDFQWAVITKEGETILVRPNESRVVGVLVDPSRPTEPALLALENDQQTLTLSGRNWRRKILQANAPIDRVTVSNAAAHIAYSTVKGEIVVYSLYHQTDLCRYVQGGPA